jgi:hypothetical protein
MNWSNAGAIASGPISAGFNDKPTITADPSASCRAYVVWDRDFEADQTPSGFPEAPAYFSSTDDCGHTWETPRIVYSAAGATTIGHVLKVLPNGDLIDMFTRGLTSGQDKTSYDIALVRSQDKGQTWTQPLSVSGVVTAPLEDPYSTFPIQPEADLATIATISVNPVTGRINIAWQDARFSGGDHIDIAYTTSADGYTWTDPVKINGTTGDVPAFVPTSAVASDGSVGVLYYDLRDATPDQPTIATDLWLARCPSACEDSPNWNEQQVSGPFDLQRAPYGHGFFLGDYEGMIAGSQGFCLLYAVTEPPTAAAYSNVYFSCAGPP